jgi:hypothetical protein
MASKNPFISLFSFIFIFSSSVYSASFDQSSLYQLVEGKPMAYLGTGRKLAPVKSDQVLKMRFKIKKFRIERTSSGPKISFFEVCEKNTRTEVRDMTGGGLMQEEIFGTCPAKWMGKDVLVVLSGMVYDNYFQDFSDEGRELKRNFFSHLTVEGTIGGFGLGDFNLDNTKTLNFGHWVSDLSVDPRYTPLDANKMREGFTASIRYEE